MRLMCLLHKCKIYNILDSYVFADLFTESRTLRKRRQTNSTVTVTERRRKPVTVSDILSVLNVEIILFVAFFCVHCA